MKITIPVAVTAIHISILSAIAFVLSLLVPLGSFFVGLVAFVYAYLPLPALAIWSGIFGGRRNILGSGFGLCVGLLGAYFILAFMSPESIEVVGDTTIERYFGSPLNQANEFESYIFPVIVMTAAIKLYWHVFAKEASKNET